MKTTEKVFDENSTLEDFKNLKVDQYAREANRYGKVVDNEIWHDLTDGDNDEVLVTGYSDPYYTTHSEA
ncbi:hypothetical protein [Pedobacter jamesrossensis]|uniref:Peptide modification target, TIGR04139 family n=1 Tax=Pedobacter jamesrossensis TaxID=1908238 RepID=A0ABV8NJI0_9SPHI